MDNENYDIILKIVLIGNSGVGKSNILSRLLENEFIENSNSTIGVDFCVKSLKVENKIVKTQIWDTAGLEQFRSLMESYYIKASGAFVVYDVTNKDSFDKIDEFIQNFMKRAIKNAHIIIIGNKCDLEDKRQITKEQGELKAKKYGADFMETSAFSGENIDKAFEKLIKEIYKKMYGKKQKEEVKVKVKEIKNEENKSEGESKSKENKKIKDELEHYKNEYDKLKKEYDKLKDDNEKLNNELIKAKKLISNIDNKSNENANLNEIINLKNIILQKDNEILNLKLKLQNIDNNNNKKSVNYDDILFVHFISSDQNINCGIKCLKTDTFAEVEEKLYQKYEEYRETNNNFIAKGRIILRFKKIFENNINDGDKIELLKLE